MPKPGARLLGSPQLLTRPLPHSSLLSNARRCDPTSIQPTTKTSSHQQVRNHFVAVMTLPTGTGSGYTKAVGTGSMGRAAATSNAASESWRSSSATASSAINATGGVSAEAANVFGGSDKESTYGFALSPVPTNPLGEGRCIRTAAALVIGDEILNGKTMEKNSHYFAKYCFDLGIDLKRVEVVADDEQEIIEAARRMVANYDFVITTGGIGPTHDDITYASLAKAFNQNLAHHPETLRRMNTMNKHREWVASQNSQQKEATRRMALFPDGAEVLFVGRDIWVPVIRLEGKLCVFPGIPALFQKMLNGLTHFLPLPPECDRPKRIQVFTERPESMIAPYLTSLQGRLKPHDVQVGSYPLLGKGVFVSLIGRNQDSAPQSICLAEVAKEVEREIGGRVVSEDEVAEKKAEAKKLDPDGVAAAAVTSQPAAGSAVGFGVPKAKI